MQREGRSVRDRYARAWQTQKEVRVEVPEHAVRQLEDIWDFYADEADEHVANRIIQRIVNDMDRLLQHPRGVQVEPLMDHIGLGHRWAVSGHYKIIYCIIDDLIFVTDIFDSRQDPEKMAW